MGGSAHLLNKSITKPAFPQPQTRFCRIEGADLKALAGTPQLLVPAPRADQFIYPVATNLQFQPPDDPLVVGNGNVDRLAIQWGPTGGNYFLGLHIKDMFDVNAEGIWMINPGPALNYRDVSSIFLGQGVYVTNLGSEYTGDQNNNAVLTVVLTYLVYPRFI